MTKHYHLDQDDIIDFAYHLSRPMRILAISMAIVVFCVFYMSFSIAHAGGRCPCPRRHHHAGITHYPERARETERIRLYRDLEDDGVDENRHGPGWSCKDPVRGLGTQWIGTKGAWEAAKKDWMERVRYDIGEKYVDTTNAEHIVRRCSRVSIAEVAGQVTYRCEMIAKPCKADLEEVQKQPQR